MRTVQLTGLRTLELRDVPAPAKPAAGEVLLRVDVVGVCGSDMHYYRTGRIGSQVVQYPFTIGHECACTVLEVGPADAKHTDVKHADAVLSPGDRVAVDPLIACGQCDQCLAGREHTCRNQRFLGCPGQVPGALSELLVMPARCCIKVPSGMTQVQATLTEPFAIGLYAYRLSRLADITSQVDITALANNTAHAGKTLHTENLAHAGNAHGTLSVGVGAPALILGAGPIGLSVLSAIKAQDPRRPVYMTDIRPYRLEVARAMGADWTGDPRKIDLITELREQVPLGFAAAFECAGEQETVDQAMLLLAPGGQLMLVGIPEADRIYVTPDIMRRKEIAIQNVRRQNNCTADAVAMVASRQVNLDPMVTHQFALSDTKAAFDTVADYTDGVVKAMIFME